MEHYQVARATARQATGVLKHEGLAVAEHGRGLFVAAATPALSMADMTFSISASGTQEQALASLGKLNLTDELGKATADLLIKAVTLGPSEVVGGKYPHYSVSAYGHSSEGVYPSLSISLGCTAVPVPEDPEPEAASL